MTVFESTRFRTAADGTTSVFSLEYARLAAERPQRQNDLSVNNHRGKAIRMLFQPALNKGLGLGKGVAHGRTAVRRWVEPNRHLDPLF